MERKNYALYVVALFTMVGMMEFKSEAQGVSINTNGEPATAGSMLHVFGTTRFGFPSSVNGTLIFNNAGNSNTVTISPGTTTTSYSLVLPPVQAAQSDYVLINDGSGNLSWGPPSLAWQLKGNSGTNPATDFVGTKDAQPLRFATSGAERIRINAAANEVGIGTTASNGTTLDISNSTTNGIGLQVAANSLTTGTGLNLSGNALTSGTGLMVASSTSGLTSAGVLGNFSLTGNNASNAGTVLKASSTGASNTGTVLMATNAGSGASFRVNDDGTDSDASPFVVDAAGNTGIGTTTPGQKLHVYGGDNASSVIAATTNVLGKFQNPTADGSACIDVYTTSSSGHTFNSRLGINPTYNVNGVGPGVYAWYARYDGTDGHLMMYDYVNKNLNFAPPSSPINNVAVGLGQPTVGSKLTVNGNFAISNGTGTYATTAAPAGGAIIEGNVGIGTSSPSRNLDVNGTIRVGTSGTTVTNIVKATVNKNIASCAANQSITETFTVTGANTGGSVMISPASALNDGLIIAWARVSAANTVSVYFRNVTGSAIDMGAMNYYITVVE
ncbi:MAG: hypothetical protein K1X82_06530 [Bacteroidia bacterium]|nr:hypothetical protein [Bacteroidia bacterium]